MDVAFTSIAKEKVCDGVKLRCHVFQVSRSRQLDYITFLNILNSREGQVTVPILNSQRCAGGICVFAAGGLVFGLKNRVYSLWVELQLQIDRFVLELLRAYFTLPLRNGFEFISITVTITSLAAAFAATVITTTFHTSPPANRWFPTSTRRRADM